jgi:hypothetical protein
MDEELTQAAAARLLHDARIGCSGTRCDPDGDDLSLWHYEPADRLRAALATADKPLTECEHRTWYDDHGMTRCEECRRWRDEIMFERGYRGEGEWQWPTPTAPALDVERQTILDFAIGYLEVNNDLCRFDHHGGCQEHGYLSLEPGEECPQGAALRALAALSPTTDTPE